jgi:hypothetical protein
MKPSPWLIFVGKALICLLFTAYSCAGRNDDESKYIYKAAKENQFVREYTSESNSHPAFIYSPSYPKGRVVTYYAQ